VVIILFLSLSETKKTVTWFSASFLYDEEFI